MTNKHGDLRRQSYLFILLAVLLDILYIVEAGNFGYVV